MDHVCTAHLQLFHFLFLREKNVDLSDVIFLMFFFFKKKFGSLSEYMKLNESGGVR